MNGPFAGGANFLHQSYTAVSLKQFNPKSCSAHSYRDVWLDIAPIHILSWLIFPAIKFSLTGRFNLGFEPAIIRSHQPLRLYEWHSVILSRNGKVGNLTVDSKSPVTGISKGGSTGLNLNQDLYIGGVPDFLSISTLAGFKSGFIGCLSYLMVDGNVVNLGERVKFIRYLILLLSVEQLSLQNCLKRKEMAHSVFPPHRKVCCFLFGLCFFFIDFSGKLVM